jgi:GTP cyclohydrolase IB
VDLGTARRPTVRPVADRGAGNLHEWVRLRRPRRERGHPVNPATASYAPALERDVQAELDARGVAIDRVGVRGLRYPISVACRDLPPQTVVATWELTVSLLPTQRGTHMSRFVETLDEWAANPLDGSALLSMLDDLRGRFDGCEAHASVSFTMFLERQAPVSGMSSKLAIECRLDAQRGEETAEVTLGVRVPVTSLCPCSKEISDYGAHSQRGYVTIEALAESSGPLSFEDLVDVAEASGSAPIYPLLKRPDERFVTMQAYDTPAFVEDVVRTASLALMDDPRVNAFVVEAENQESIHDHAAVATVRWERSS